MRVGSRLLRLGAHPAGAAEAVNLTDDYKGESHSPMWFDGRVYFVSDKLAAHFAAEPDDLGLREQAFRTLVYIKVPPRSLEEFTLDALDGLRGQPATGAAAKGMSH